MYKTKKNRRSDLSSISLPNAERSEGDGSCIDSNQMGHSVTHIDDGHLTQSAVHKVKKKKKPSMTTLAKPPLVETNVPHEPYKAAVHDVVDRSRLHSYLIPLTGVLCRSGSTINETAANNWPVANRAVERIVNVSEVPSAERVWSAERDRLEAELRSSHADNFRLETQLQMQTQVNGELKRLLVASVGEDMETRVGCLTEDKTRLAHSLLHYSKKHTENNEHLERLTIQCDVWRSKFLATSLMVDELAIWKAVLSYRLDEALDAIRILLDEFNEVHRQSRNAIRCIESLHEQLELKTCDSPNSVRRLGNIIDDTKSIVEMTENLHHELLNSEPINRTSNVTRTSTKEHQTKGQRLAQQIVTNRQNIDMPPSNSSSDHHRMMTSLAQRFHPNTRYEHLTFNCCGQCKGDIKLM